MSSQETEVSKDLSFFPKEKKNVFTQNKSTIINFEVMDECAVVAFLKKLPSSQHEGFKFKNCNSYQKDSDNEITSFIHLTFSALTQNKHIKTLELGPEFMKSYLPNLYCKNPATYCNLQALHKMSSLTTLILKVDDTWDERSFKSLRLLLVDPKCNIKNLQIKGGILPEQRDALIESFSWALKLERYEGPYKELSNYYTSMPR